MLIPAYLTALKPCSVCKTDFFFTFFLFFLLKCVLSLSKIKEKRNWIHCCCCCCRCLRINTTHSHSHYSINVCISLDEMATHELKLAKPKLYQMIRIPMRHRHRHQPLLSICTRWTRTACECDGITDSNTLNSALLI